MSWNYRVTRHVLDEGVALFEIREVYYTKKKITGWTENPTTPAGDTVEELRTSYVRMADAFNAPVLDITDEDNPYDVEDP